MSVPELEAWRDLCRRLERAGEALLESPFPQSDRDRAEGFDHLARQLLCWLGWSTGYGDPGAPSFMRQNDLVLQWGGPNVDNVYRHARIDPTKRYRITGRMNSCEQFVLALRAGFMHQPKWGTLTEITASSLGINAGSDIRILLGQGDASDGFIPIPDDAIMVSLREYYFEWSADEPATFAIECLDSDGVAPVEPVDLVTRFTEAASGVELSMSHWNRYLLDYRAAGHDNTFSEPIKVAKGLDAARYSFCFWNLGPDDALIVHTTVPDAAYWSLQTYLLGWFRAGDFAHHITSLNHRQVTRTSGGTVHVVLAHRDPGTPNWIDTEGRSEGMLSYRWFWGTDNPTVSTKVVRHSDVRANLPADTPLVSVEARADEIAARRAHASWRYRS